MSKTKVLYRADGGHPVGMGHIMRALRVTRELSRLVDLEVLLVSRSNPSVARVLSKENPPYLRVHWISSVRKAIIPVLGAAEFVETAVAYEPDIIVVDALDTPEEDMRLLATVGARLVTQDDRGPGRVYANLICNFLVRDPEPTALESGTTLLEGPEYAPLDQSYVGASIRRRAVEPECARILMVTLGGADALGLAINVAEAVVTAPMLDEVRFNVGPAFERMEDLKERTARAPWEAKLLVNVPSLLPAFLDSDMAIVAGGITMHEAACCGVPALAVCQPIDHQLLVADRLENAGAMLNLGYGTEMNTESIASAVRELAADRARRQQMHDAGPRTVDGLGSRRVAEAIVALAAF